MEGRDSWIDKETQPSGQLWSKNIWTHYELTLYPT